MGSTKPDDDTLYIDTNGGLHKTAGECIEANLQIESINGQFVTGGNCGQSPDNIPQSNSTGSESSESTSEKK